MLKPMITDVYRCFFSVINTLTHRAKTLCSTPDSTKQELEHLEKALMGCKYPRWTIQQEETTSSITEDMPHGSSIFQRDC